jgi:hypothetical protein
MTVPLGVTSISRPSLVEKFALEEGEEEPPPVGDLILASPTGRPLPCVVVCRLFLFVVRVPPVHEEEAIAPHKKKPLFNIFVIAI